MERTAVLALTLVSLQLILPAFAAIINPPEQPPRGVMPEDKANISPAIMFRVFDNDKDGFVSGCEWMEAGMTNDVRMFVSILDDHDADNDNLLSWDEFKSLIEASRRRYEEQLTDPETKLDISSQN